MRAVRGEPLIQNERETLQPTPDRDMAYREAALGRHLLPITVAKGISQVPATQYADSFLEVSPAE
jgi:hypothetical protein